MRRQTAIRTTLACAALLAAGGCATLGGNVKGSFACRAPEGTCAPTSQIDAAATAGARGESRPASPAVHREGARTLRIVIAGYRDAEGRRHEPRVVHAVLPEPAWHDWREPQERGAIARDLARALAPSANDPSPEPVSPPAPAEFPDPPLQRHALDPLPQPVPAEPGGMAPGDGGSGVFPPLHVRVPHFVLPQADAPAAEPGESQ
ncbi:MAG: TraV family lipoprotein [Altererythrobacter sp.]|nr:TraV family lipoprotein [Altererythrobacter sp.]